MFAAASKGAREREGRRPILGSGDSPRGFLWLILRVKKVFCFDVKIYESSLAPQPVLFEGFLDLVEVRLGNPRSPASPTDVLLPCSFQNDFDLRFGHRFAQIPVNALTSAPRSNDSNRLR